MREILILLRDITETGGGERVCANLSNALSASCRVRILSFHKKEDFVTYRLNPEIKVEYLSKGAHRSPNLFKRFLNRTVLRVFLSLKASSIIRRNRPDIVFCNDGTFIPILKTRGVKYLRLWHLNVPKKKKRVFSRYDSLVVLSEKQMETWRQYHNNIKVIPNFLPEITADVTNYAQKTVLSVGRMDTGDQKGFMRLVDIWRKVQDNAIASGWKLCMVGEGEIKSDIEAKVNALNLRDSVVMKPFTSKIAEEYMQASIYAMTSRFEGFGMVLAESASYGLPGVAFDINAGPSDIISDGESGFLVDDNDLDVFAEKLLLLMQDEELRRKLGIRAKEIVSAKFSKDTIVAQWSALFDELLA